jgi:hypothetical protein
MAAGHDQNLYEIFADTDSENDAKIEKKETENRNDKIYVLFN